MHGNGAETQVVEYSFDDETPLRIVVVVEATSIVVDFAQSGLRLGHEVQQIRVVEGDFLEAKVAQRCVGQHPLDRDVAVLVEHFESAVVGDDVG